MGGRWVGALVALGVAGSAATIAAAAPTSGADFVPPAAATDHLNRDDWSDLQGTLSGIYGEVTSPLKISDLDKGSYTTGQLVGNGDVGAIAADTSTSGQQLYFGKNDFWGTLHAQGSSVKDNQGILNAGGLDIRGAGGSQAASAFSARQDLLNAQVTTNLQLKDDAGADAPVTLQTWTADTADVVVTQIANSGAGPVTLTTKAWVPKMAYASASASDLTDAQGTYPYGGGTDGSTLWISRDSGATSGYRSRLAEATTVVGAPLRNAREVVAADDYYDSNKGRYYDSLGEAGEFTVPANGSVSLVTYFASSSGADSGVKSVDAVRQDAVDGLNAYTTPTAVDQLRAEHLAWWKDYWLRSYAHWGDPDVDAYYYGSLYVLGSSNRPASPNGKVNPQDLPGSMYGEWVPADNVGWGGRYFLNYNQQAQYYASGSANRIETETPYNRVIAYDLPWQLNNAAAQGHDGAVHNRTLTPFHLMTGATTTPTPKAPTKVWGFSSGSTDQKSNGYFAAVQMVSYYQYTLDDAYLRGTLYPYLKQLMAFYSSYVLKQDDGSYAVIGSSIHEGDAADIDPDLDIGAIKALGRFLIAHAPEFGEPQATVDRWRDLVEHTAFPEAMLPKGIFDAHSTGGLVPTLLATDYQSPDQPHVDMIEPGDQPVELEGVVFPFENVQVLDGDKELLAKVRNTLEYMNSWAAGSFAGWSSQNNGFPKVFPIAARAGWPAADFLAKFKTALAAKVRTSNLTYYGSGGAVETVGAMEGLNSLVLQSDTSPSMPTTLEVFPNWDRTRDMRFARLGAKGNVEVSSEIDGGTIPYVDITSRRDGKVALVDPWTQGRPVIRQVNDHTLGADVPYTISGGKLIFDAAKGGRYMVMVDASDPVTHANDLSLSRYSDTLVAGGEDTVTADHPVTWTSSDTGVATVSGGTIHAVAAGTATISATSTEDPGLTQSVKVRVADPATVPTGLTLVSPKSATIYGPAGTDPSTGKVTGADRLQLTATVQPANAYDTRILWSSSDPDVAMVDKNGLVIARGAGTATITGRALANPSATTSMTVKVTGAGQDFSGYGPLRSAIAAAAKISKYAGDGTGSGGFTRVSDKPEWEGRQVAFQKAYINALGVADRYSGYATTAISKDTAYFAAIALNQAIKAIDPSLAITLPDKTALTAAIGRAGRLSRDDFGSDDAWNALQAALAHARTVAADPDATQNDADDAVAALQQAMSAARVAPIPTADISGNVTAVTVTGGNLVQLAGVSGPFSGDDVDPTSGLVYAPDAGTYTVTAGGRTIPVTFVDPPGLLNLAVAGDGTPFGSTSTGSYPPPNAFDGNASSFFDHSSSTPYVGWDFGSPRAVNVLRFLPRSGTNAKRIAGAVLQGSNTSPSSGYVDLFTITDAPATASSSDWYAKPLANATAYRYYRWLGVNGSHGNVAEIQLFAYTAHDARVTTTTGVSTHGDVGGDVPATLSLTLGAPASFGAFTPGVDHTYTASTTADVVSTAGDAQLTVSGPDHLTNGAFGLAEPLQILGVPRSWDAPVSHDTFDIGFSQHIGATEPLRTGSYSAALTFTLSTDTP